MSKTLKIAMVAGETSGDMLGAGLIRELRSRHPRLQCHGIAGPRMQGQGCEAWHQAEELAVFGLVEVISHLRRLLKLRARLLQRLLADPPDVFIGIDAPEFNLGLELKLRAAGIKTIHYVSPSVWAWRSGRVKKIARAVDRMLTLFPFEPDFYAAHAVDARFVGHPMADEIPAGLQADEARIRLGLDPARTTIALLPGSRNSEVRRLAGLFLRCAAELSERYPGIQIVTALASDSTRELFEDQLADFPGVIVRVCDSSARTVLQACDAALLASGTVSLEAMLVNRPMVVCYRVAVPSYWISRLFRLLKTEHIALPNILAGERLVPEYFQSGDASELAAAMSHWLDSPVEVSKLQSRFAAIHEQLRRGASERAAEAVLELLQ